MEDAVDGTSLKLESLRGEANIGLSIELASKLGQAAGLTLPNEYDSPRVLIGKDTRRPNYMLETALTSGFISVGAEVLLTGPLPKPAVALLTRSMRADLGVMIGGSHKTFRYSGFELFSARGGPLDERQKSYIEKLLHSDLKKKIAEKQPERASRITGAAERYLEIVKATLPGRSFEGLRIVVDCANGASYVTAPRALRELGAEVVAIGIEPNGFNINRSCGSHSPKKMIEKVKEFRADFGLALDGAGEEVVLVDREGRLVCGAKASLELTVEDKFVNALHAIALHTIS